MPVLVIAVVFLIIFLVMGVMGVSAMVAEHKGHVFTWHWSEGPFRTFLAKSKPRFVGKPRLFGSEL